MTSSSENEMQNFADAVKRISAGVDGFKADMQRQGIHVGWGAKPLARCLNCGEKWPCAGSRRHAG